MDTKGTPFYRLRTPAWVVTIILTLLGHGCPLQAILRSAQDLAFRFDERTVAKWRVRAGKHCQGVHEHLVQQGAVDLQHVQADELWVKMVGRRVWMAMAIAVPSRLWLGGVISPRRDLVLITALVEIIRSCGSSPAIPSLCSGQALVCVDGLSSYVNAFLRVFRKPVRTGRKGRPRLVLEKGLLLGQVVKEYAQRRVVSVSHRIVRGTPEAIAAALVSSAGGHGINTSFIERLNATFRSALAPLVRRGRAIARKEAVLTAAMYLVGCAYNFCCYHENLRLAAPEGASHKWQERTPAMAAGLTDHLWTMRGLLQYQIPLPAWVAPKRRGRPPKQAYKPVMAIAA